MGTCCLTDMLESQNSKRIHVILQQTHEWIFLSSFQINFWITWLERKVGRLDPVGLFSLITKFKKETCNLATNPWMNIPIIFSNKLLNYLIREKSKGRLDPVGLFSLITKFKKETCNLATNPWMNIPIIFSNNLLNYLIREKSRSVGPSRSFLSNHKIQNGNM